MNLTKNKICQLGQKILFLLEKYDASDMVEVYCNNDQLTISKGIIWTKKDVDPHKIFDYAAYDHILSMSFEGKFYEEMNHRGGRLKKKFDELVGSYDLYYELGNSWNLTMIPLNPEDKIAYTHYEKPKERIRLHYWSTNVPYLLRNIMNIWFSKAKAYGDKGSCVIGAGFSFDYNGDEYFMSACSPYQGSLSWEDSKDEIESELRTIGCENIKYDWGIMD